MYLHQIISPASIRFVVFPPRDFQFLVYPQVYDVWVFIVRDLMIEDDVYSIGRYIDRLPIFQELVFTWIFVTRSISIKANGVGHLTWGQSWSEKRGRYLSNEFSTDWIIAVDFFEGARRKRFRIDALAGC